MMQFTTDYVELDGKPFIELHSRSSPVEPRATRIISVKHGRDITDDDAALAECFREWLKTKHRARFENRMIANGT